MLLKQLIGNIKEKVNDALVNVNKKENARTFRDIDEQVSNVVTKLKERIGTVHEIFETQQKSFQERDKKMLRQSKLQVEGLLKLAEEAQQTKCRANWKQAPDFFDHTKTKAAAYDFFPEN